jgi:hypothetical protein
VFREVSVVEVREVLRLWVRGHGLREIARLAGVDRKTVRRHLTAAVATGLDPGGGEALLTDAAVGAVLVTMRGGRPPGRGGGWEELAAERQFIEERLKEELTLTKVHVLLRRRGCTVPYRTLHRFCVAEFGFGRDRSTVRVADCEPGTELQVDYGRMGLLFDPFRQRRRGAPRPAMSEAAAEVAALGTVPCSSVARITTSGTSLASAAQMRRLSSRRRRPEQPDPLASVASAPPSSPDHLNRATLRCFCASVPVSLATRMGPPNCQKLGTTFGPSGATRH